MKRRKSSGSSQETVDDLGFRQQRRPRRPSTIPDSEEARSETRRISTTNPSEHEDHSDSTLQGHDGSEENSLGEADFEEGDSPEYSHYRMQSPQQAASPPRRREGRQNFDSDSSTIAAPPPPPRRRASSFRGQHRVSRGWTPEVGVYTRSSMDHCNEEESRVPAPGTSQAFPYGSLGPVNRPLRNVSSPCDILPSTPLGPSNSLFSNTFYPEQGPELDLLDPLAPPPHNTSPPNLNPSHKLSGLDDGHHFGPFLFNPKPSSDTLDPTNDLFFDAFSTSNNSNPTLSETTNSTPLTVSPIDVMANYNQQNDLIFQEETLRGLARGDVCYAEPDYLSDEPSAIHSAMALTRLDYQQRILGGFIPDEYEHWLGSYASRHRHLQQSFEWAWRGPGPAPMLYRLGEWTGGFEDWQIAREDFEGRRLLREVQEVDAKPEEIWL